MVKANHLVHGATNYKGDSPTFAVSRATPAMTTAETAKPREACHHPAKAAANADFRSSYQGEADDVLPWDMPKYRSTFTGRRDGLMGDETFKRVQSIIAAYLEIVPSKVMLPTSFVDDLHADSLDMIELIMAFEDAFDVMIPDIAMGTIVTVQDAVDYIKQQQRKPRRSGVPGS
jgi:acyl carrier protein